MPETALKKMRQVTSHPPHSRRDLCAPDSSGRRMRPAKGASTRLISAKGSNHDICFDSGCVKKRKTPGEPVSLLKGVLPFGPPGGTPPFCPPCGIIPCGAHANSLELGGVMHIPLIVAPFGRLNEQAAFCVRFAQALRASCGGPPTLLP